MQMNIACGQAPGIVSKGRPLRGNHKEIQSLVIESGDNRIQSEDIVKLTGWYYLSVLNVLRDLERVGVVPSEVMVYTQWYTLTEEA
ncbi:MAG: hypothetical protein HXS48_17340 [Theionarchaea archaeon]|nr:hypothetical protein [Theionarchaea archaeon]